MGEGAASVTGRTQAARRTYSAGMPTAPLTLAVSAQQAVNDAAAEHRRLIAARDQAVCEANREGHGRKALADALGVSVSTIDHILDPRRCP
jgi:DNA-binding NarL/FixJ family response regulator